MARLFFTVSGRTTIAASDNVTVVQLKASANTPVVIHAWEGGGPVVGQFELCGQTADATGSDVARNKMNPNHNAGVSPGETIGCTAKLRADATNEAAITSTPFVRQDTKSFDIGFGYGLEPVIRGGNRVGLKIKNTDSTASRDFTWTLYCEE